MPDDDSKTRIRDLRAKLDASPVDGNMPVRYAEVDAMCADFAAATALYALAATRSTPTQRSRHGEPGPATGLAARIVAPAPLAGAVAAEAVTSDGR